ncbi:MAG: 23S rRNA (adenine(2503)-C(2))-methyltransferase RlmN [Candidatus Tectomicrobia bacterium]|uniref:Probable dual-specificity RNA methyltransferase RlmN n=1 Tax=Tectimicrobiota bacterium TaxID=2528274 RepID=A0A937W3Q7_UNCTE|nr:23S rRNA (adenine(2503)-C(2))-methyltransferase RlmN [Candidatus Tectomicrobia bacterium]
MALTDLRDLQLHDMAALLAEAGEPAFRATQLCHWVYKRQATAVQHMTDLPEALRQRLSHQCYVSTLAPLRQQQSEDGTQKWLFRLEDGNQIETVLIPAGDKRTICVSTQVGCAIGCRFCLTAQGGLVRSLRPAEIVSQVLHFQEPGKTPERAFSNIVFMGMGEPLDNFHGTVQAIRTLTADWGLGISPRRITVSTSGLVRRLEAFGREDLKVQLAVSLNATTDAVRTEIMPINKAYPLDTLLASCRAFPLAMRQRITFEYVLLRDVNDTLDDAKRLVKLMHGLRCKINLLPFNEIPGVPYQRPSEDTVQRFQTYLAQHGLSAFVRQSRGRDISAACGQLRFEERTMKRLTHQTRQATMPVTLAVPGREAGAISQAAAERREGER